MTAAVDIVAGAFPGRGRCDRRGLSPLALAYLGDTIYDLYVRTYLVSCIPHTPNALHRLSARHVCATGQAAGFQRVEPMLDEEEMAVYKRGRNAHCGTLPKNASAADYHMATGLEALIGWLWLGGDDGRVTELMRRILEED